jgi:hypothetical protein
MGPSMNHFELYDACVTQPLPVVRFLQHVHGARPKILREDFAGTAAVARQWLHSVPKGQAVAVDRDPKPLAHAALAGVTCVVSDVLRCRTKADVVTATNFALGYCHSRAELVAYLRHARACLKPRGIFVADVYGGSHAMLTGQHVRTVPLEKGPACVEFVFEQRATDPVLGLVENALHFGLKTSPSSRPRWLRNAFVYRWRLWSPAELTDALGDAGFAAPRWFDSLGDEETKASRAHEHKPGQPLEDDWVLHLAARR